MVRPLLLGLHAHVRAVRFLRVSARVRSSGQDKARLSQTYFAEITSMPAELLLDDVLWVSRPKPNTTCSARRCKNGAWRSSMPSMLLPPLPNSCSSGTARAEELGSPAADHAAAVITITLVLSVVAHGAGRQP